MRGLVKFMVLVGSVLLVETAILAVVLLLSIARYGAIEVIVHDRVEQRRIEFHLPAFPVNGVLDAASLIVPVARVCNGGHLHSASGRAMAAEIDAAPDFTLLDVVDTDAHVQVRKRGGRLQMQVNSDDADVWVQIPRSTVRHMARLAGGV